MHNTSNKKWLLIKKCWLSLIIFTITLSMTLLPLKTANLNNTVLTLLHMLLLLCVIGFITVAVVARYHSKHPDADASNHFSRLLVTLYIYTPAILILGGAGLSFVIGVLPNMVLLIYTVYGYMRAGDQVPF